MSEWSMMMHVPSRLQEALVRHGKMLFFLEESSRDYAHVCVDERDGSLYVAVFRKSPYHDTRDFNAPDFVPVRYGQLPMLIQRALSNERGSDAGKYTGMTALNWQEFINRK